MPENKSVTSIATIVVALIGAAATILVAVINRVPTSVQSGPNQSGRVSDSTSPMRTGTSSSATPSLLDHSQETVSKAKKLFDAKQYSLALPLFRRAAQAGISEAATYMGELYELGEGGLPEDEYQAISWYRKAAEAGDAQGMYFMGESYEYGKGGLPDDQDQAISWYRKAAQAGDPTAMFSVGMAYEDGTGSTPVDIAAAVSWYQKSAALGVEDSKKALKRLGY